MRSLNALLAALALAACAAPAGPAVVSTQSPPMFQSLNRNTPQQTLNSLPRGAANFPSGAIAPQDAGIAIHAF